MIRRCCAVTGLVVCAIVAFVASASTASAQYNPTECTFIVTPTSVNAGETVSITGQGFPTGQTVTFYVDGIPIANATATEDSSGAVSTTATIPATLPEGSYEITVDCAGVSSTQTINVSSASSSGNAGNAGGSGSTSGSLAGTGADPLPFVKVALMLLAIGGLIVLATKRRHQVRT